MIATTIMSSTKVKPALDRRRDARREAVRAAMIA
jgi:hypothetical protein